MSLAADIEAAIVDGTRPDIDYTTFRSLLNRMAQSDEELAEGLEVSRGTVLRWKTGATAPHWRILPGVLRSMADLLSASSPA